MENKDLKTFIIDTRTPKEIFKVTENYNSLAKEEKYIMLDNLLNWIFKEYDKIKLENGNK